MLLAPCFPALVCVDCVIAFIALVVFIAFRPVTDDRAARPYGPLRLLPAFHLADPVSQSPNLQVSGLVTLTPHLSRLSRMRRRTGDR